MMTPWPRVGQGVPPLHPHYHCLDKGGMEGSNLPMIMTSHNMSPPLLEEDEESSAASVPPSLSLPAAY